ncbi:MAG: Mrp/NBP35 family ATP-binding protein [Euryarchaeota archaeon]|nr:Mrp/NBP35 family ATP-binding protein [Euryarchaeota archaeon]
MVDEAALERLKEAEKRMRNLSRMAHKVAVMSGKGGVGKSTVAVNLAYSLRRLGARVGLLDLDITNPNVPRMAGVFDQRLTGDENTVYPVEADGVKIVSTGLVQLAADTPFIGRGPWKIGVMKQFLGDVSWGDLDYLVMDLPPGTSDEPLSVSQEIPQTQGDGAVIVTTPQDVSLMDIRKAVNFCKMVQIPVIGIVENMSGFTCPNCKKRHEIFKSGGGEETARKMGVPFLGRIPIDPAVALNGDKGRPYVLAAPESEAAKGLLAIAKKVQAALEHPRPN